MGKNKGTEYSPKYTLCVIIPRSKGGCGWHFNSKDKNANNKPLCFIRSHHE